MAAEMASSAILPFLHLVGFTSAGVKAGSFAASMQSATTESGSVFAQCQSAGATGSVAKSTSVGVSLVAGTIAGITTAVVRKKKSDSKNNGAEEQAESEEAKNVQEDHDEQCGYIEEQVEYKLHSELSQL